MDTPLIEKGVSSPDSLAACLNAYGLYHIEQFVLRLSPIIHEQVDSATKKAQRDITNDEYIAYSTYLHETVHWWQHIGTTCGLITSLCYPAQSHKTFSSIQEIVNSGEFTKPLKIWVEKKTLEGLDHKNDIIKNANIAINYAIDLNYYKSIIMFPESLRTLSQSNYFESIGHSFKIAYESVLSILSASLDPEYKFLPNPDDYHESFQKLKKTKSKGFYFQSDITLPPINGVEILEGQARFIQLQFLSFLSKKHLTILEVAQDGYLDGVYGKAFTLFQSIVKKNAENIGEPLVGIFLLICDIALNPAEGFPMPIKNVAAMIEDCDPNFRFTRLCVAAKDNLRLLESLLNNYSKDEYIKISKLLTSACGLIDHYESLSEVQKWINTEASVQKLMSEKETFNYSPADLVIRVIFSHYLSLSQDKIESPEFFCWTGVCKTRNANQYTQLWLRNLSLFTDKAHEDGVYPRVFPDKDVDAIKQTFNTFYANNLIYDLTRQLILSEGPFKYQYEWLVSHEKVSELEKGVKERFQRFYNIHPDEIEISNS